MAVEKITEAQGPNRHLENMSVHHLLTAINQEDAGVPAAVALAIPQIEKLIEAAIIKMRAGGRLFYIGAGTSGRLGILDASEVPPTFGMPNDRVIALIAGGAKAIRFPVENAEDDMVQGWLDLQEHGCGPDDFVIGIASSGTTPYVISALENCLENGIETACITCNPGTPLAAAADFSGGSDRRTGNCNRKYTNEKRYGAEACTQHDLHGRHDRYWPGRGFTHGQHAIIKQQTDRTGNPDAHESNRYGRLRSSPGTSFEIR